MLISKQVPIAEVQRILVIRGGGLGDFVLILPVLAALRQKWPRATVELLSNPEMGELAHRSQYAASVRSIHQAEFAAFFSDNLLESQICFLEGFDLVISFLGDLDGCLERNLRAAVPQVLFVPSPAENRVHASSQFLASLETLQIYTEDCVPKLAFSPRARATAGEALPALFADPHSFPIALHPGSGSPRKNWSTRGYAEVIRWIREKLRSEPLLITGEADAETRRNLREELGGPPIFELRSASLRILASVLQCCSLLVGNDCGVSHLAAALGTPVLALFGPTSPEVWRPLGKRVQVLRFEEATPGRVHREIARLLR